MYLKHCIPLRLSDEQMVERDASILRQRVENRKKIDAKWQVAGGRRYDGRTDPGH
jgi:hypothetical protein